jgi:hypothetical protein
MASRQIDGTCGDWARKVGFPETEPKACGFEPFETAVDGVAESMACEVVPTGVFETHLRLAQLAHAAKHKKPVRPP